MALQLTPTITALIPIPAWRFFSRTVLVCAMISLAPFASADDGSLQTALFQDCEASQKIFDQSSPEQQETALVYLTRVLGLSTQAPSAPEAFAVLPGGKGPDMSAPALWQTTDAKRELYAKRCALDLLSHAGAKAFDILPTLITLYSNQPLSDEIAVGVEETAATIAEDAHRAGKIPSEDVVDSLLPLLKSSRPLVVQNFFHEYATITLPRVILYLGELSASETAPTISFLSDVDPSGMRAFSAFLAAAPHLSAEAIRHLSESLPLPSREATTPLIPDIARLTITPDAGPSMVKILAEICGSSGKLPLDPSLAARLAQYPAFITDPSISFEEQSCLFGSLPALAPLIIGWLSSSQDGEVIRALELLPSTTPLLDGERRVLVLTQLKGLSEHQNSAIREKAILSLALFPEKRTDIGGFLLQSMRASISSKGPKTSVAVLSALYKVAFDLALYKEASKFSPLVLQTLRQGISSDSIALFASKFDSLESALTSLAAHRTTEVAKAALLTLKNRERLSKGSLNAIGDSLLRPELSSLAEGILGKRGESSLPILKTALSRSPTAQRVGILSLLVTFSSPSKMERAELANALISGDGCGVLSQRASAAGILLKDRELDEGLQQKLRAKVSSCLCLMPKEDGEAMLKQYATHLFTQPQTVAPVLDDPQRCSPLRKELINVAVSDEIPLEIRTQVIASMYAHSPSEARQIITPTLSRSSPAAKALCAALSPLARDKNDPNYAAIEALAIVGDTEFDWRYFVRDTITSSDSAPEYEMRLSAIRHLPSDIVLDEVVSALDSDNVESASGGCRVGASMGSLAIPIVSKIWNLRDKRSPAIRYAAILALLEINPLTPDLHEGIRALLVNRFYAAAVKRPIKWAQSVGVVDLDKGAFGTLRTTHLESLLVKDR